MKQSVIVVLVILLIVIGVGIYIWSAKTNNTPQTPTSESATPGEPQPNQSTQNMSHLITIKTTLGDIQFATYDSDAPMAVANFIALAEKGFYNNVIFHRVIRGFMIQGGDPTGTGRGGPGYTFADELNPATASYQAGYKKGIVAMANAGPNTNGSQFFIMLADYPLPNKYTIFGKVTNGQDVVDAIGGLQTDQNDKPLNPPSIQSVVVETAGVGQ